MSQFVYFNPTPDQKTDKKTGKPKRWNKGDCVVRGFCGVLNLTWTSCFEKLCLIAAKEFDMPNSHKVIDKMAKTNGMVKESLPEYMTVSEFARTHDGTYICNIRGHVCCVKNHSIYDTWNCGGYKMKTYYAKAA